MIPLRAKRIVIVAGGPSLRGFDFERLRGSTVIAINRAFEHIPFAQILWWSDGSFPQGAWLPTQAERVAHQRALAEHGAPWKASCQDPYHPYRYPFPVVLYRFTGISGLELRKDGLRHGNNSGHAGLNLAFHCDPEEILLLGYDMKLGQRGESHWHDGYRQAVSARTYADKMVPFFGAIAMALADRGIRVFNASPESALPYWPKGSFDDAENYFHRAQKQRFLENTS